MAFGINREYILDQIDGIKDVLSYGLWWQRLLVVGTPLLLGFFLFWVRPLPDEILEKLEFWNASEQSYYVDGAVERLAAYFQVVSPDGEVKTMSRTAWKENLKNDYDRFSKKGYRLTPTTEHRSHYWTGLYTLVEEVEQTKTLTDQHNRVVYDGRYVNQFTWKKSEEGWFIHTMELLEKEDKFTKAKSKN